MVESLPRGLDTVLGGWFEAGHEISAGQWQKLAVARAFMREAEVLVLDEPTASIDAEAEHELFQRFRALAAERTAIVISHRFSTVRIADRIAVLHGGRENPGQPIPPFGQLDADARPRAVVVPGRLLDAPAMRHAAGFVRAEVDGQADVLVGLFRVHECLVGPSFGPRVGIARVLPLRRHGELSEQFRRIRRHIVLSAWPG